MIDLTSTRGRLIALVGVDGVATIIAGGAAYLATTQQQVAYWAVFGAAVIAGFAAQFWFIAGFGRGKQGV